MATSKENYQKVYGIFQSNYVLVPLEIFGDDPYKTLVSTLLSARTKDEVTLKASERLFKSAHDITSLSKLKAAKIEKLIYPVGFYKTKAKNVLRLAKIIISDFNGEIPRTQKKLLTLPGVGIKTANLVLNRAFGKPYIAVDTHVHKIANLLKWVNTKKPEDTEKALYKVLPKKYWSDTNRLFVSIGRQYTTKKRLVEFLEKNKLL